MNHSPLWDSLDSWNIFTLSKGKITKGLLFLIQKELSHTFRLWAVIVKSMLLSNNALHLVFIWRFLKLTYFMPGHNTDHHNFNHSYVAIGCYLYMSLFKCSKVPETEFLDEIQPKVFLLAIHSELYSFALRFLFLLTHATSYSFYSSVIVHCKGERRKTWWKTKSPYLIHTETWNVRTLKIMPGTSTKLYVHEFSFWFWLNTMFSVSASK